MQGSIIKIAGLSTRRVLHEMYFRSQLTRSTIWYVGSKNVEWVRGFKLFSKAVETKDRRGCLWVAHCHISGSMGFVYMIRFSSNEAYLWNCWNDVSLLQRRDFKWAESVVQECTDARTSGRKALRCDKNDVFIFFRTYPLCDRPISWGANAWTAFNVLNHGTNSMRVLMQAKTE